MMTATYEPDSPSLVRKVFGVVLGPQTYLNVAYLLLSFPLGIAYFVILVVGFTLGFGLFITLLGIPVLLGTLGLSWVLSMFERQMSMTMLNVDIAPMSSSVPADEGVWNRFKSQMKNPVTWKGVAYLFLKFPFGVFSFCMTVVTLSVSLMMLAAPLLYRIGDYGADPGSTWRVDTLPEALGVMLLGIPAALISLWLLNSIAMVWGQFARLMLGNKK